MSQSKEMSVRVATYTDGGWDLQQLIDGSWVTIPRVVALRMEELPAGARADNELKKSMENF